MKKPKTIMFFENGNTAVFDDAGEQIGKLQKSWLRVFIEWLEDQHVDGSMCEIIMPDGREIEIIEHEEGWNWRSK